MIKENEPVWVKYTIPNGLTAELEFRFLLQCVSETGSFNLSRERMKQIMREEADSIIHNENIV